MQHTDDVLERAKKIKLLIMDVDGTLTEGKIWYNSAGDELQGFSARDGLGIHVAHKAGLKTALITGRTSAPVSIRARELEITRVYLGKRQKSESLQDVLRTFSLDAEEAAFIGDDLNDIPVMLRVGLAAAVADAPDEVLQAAHFHASRPGGRGAVRELIEFILKSQDLWSKAIRSFRAFTDES